MMSVKILCPLLLLLLANVANATLIVIEPDDFELGAQITSKYANIINYDEHEPLPVYAQLGSTYGYPAPTGSTVFGTSVVAFFDRDDVPYWGLTFEFLIPVTSVTIWTLNYDYPFPLGIDCYIWGSGASNPSGCSGSSSSVPFQGVPVQYTLDFGGQYFDKIALGGGDAIAAIVFDRLEATAVPEPSGLVLLSIGLLGIGLSSVRRRTSA